MYTLFSTLPVWNRRTDSVESKLGDGTGWHLIKVSRRTAQATDPSSRAEVSPRTFPGTTTGGRKQGFTSSRTLTPLNGSSSRHYQVHCGGHFYERQNVVVLLKTTVYGNRRDGLSAPQLRKLLLTRSNYFILHTCFIFFPNKTKLTKHRHLNSVTIIHSQPLSPVP